MVYLALIYHMHQPYYRNRLTGECSQPWVRLHGTKDYLDMLTLLREYPAVKATINLVPSLLEQLREYADCGCRDNYFELTLKPAASLTTAEKTFLKSHFFDIHRDNVIARFPRYHELLNKYEEGERYSTDDYRDLQLLFNLAWIDPSWRSSIPELILLSNKAHHFSEKDKRTVLDQQLRIIKRIIPAYAAARRTGQVELTVSPFYHPILPLLCDTDTARQAQPASPLPQRRFSRPEDAHAQLHEAIAYFTRSFGSAPDGMWPSEQGVCTRTCELMAESGIHWAVTDEGILLKTLADAGRPADRRLIYQPHAFEHRGRRLQLVFRDRDLSDRIGFAYHRREPADAVTDFMRRLDEIGRELEGRDALVTVALDGENAWDYYADDGRGFLSLLYRTLSESSRVRTTSVGEYLRHSPAENVLPKLAPGSWIFTEFSKWIGNPAKCKAWDALSEARELFERTRERLRPGTCTRAFKQLLLCEGSDWFWWYGEDPAGTFDALFRMHLSNFYVLLDQPVPAALKKPISCSSDTPPGT